MVLTEQSGRLAKVGKRLVTSLGSVQPVDATRMWSSRGADVAWISGNAIGAMVKP